MSARSYNDPNSLSAVSKQQFEAKVRKYLHQLTVGCGAPNCRNKFCSSCPGLCLALSVCVRALHYGRHVLFSMKTSICSFLVCAEIFSPYSDPEVDMRAHMFG